MKKVAILTTFYNLDTSYSLCSVVKNQLQVLVANGYETVLGVLPSFKDEVNVPEGVEIRKLVPQLILEPYAGTDSSKVNSERVAEDVEKVFEFLKRDCADIDVIITHDWMLVDTYSPYAAALQLTETDPIFANKRFLHWVHSFPTHFENKPYPWSEQYKIPKNHKIVYLNNTDVLAVAERYQGTLDDVRVVHNPTDPRTHFTLNPLTKKMVDSLGLLDCDIMQVYPISTPRMVEGKQIHKIIKLFGKLKKQGKKVKLVACNAHANADVDKKRVEKMLKLAEDCGLTKDEVIFTSFIDVPKWEHGVPHEVVRDLFLLSNLFVFPTVSENCPLILLEAALSKVLLVLNEDFAPLREFFGKDALYFKFSSLRMHTEYQDEEKYYEDMAKIIIGELAKNRPLNAFVTCKQKYNYDHIFKTELEPILWEEGEKNGLPNKSGD